MPHSNYSPRVTYGATLWPNICQTYFLPDYRIRYIRAKHAVRLAISCNVSSDNMYRRTRWAHPWKHKPGYPEAESESPTRTSRILWASGTARRAWICWMRYEDRVDASRQRRRPVSKDDVVQNNNWFPIVTSGCRGQPQSRRMRSQRCRRHRISAKVKRTCFRHVTLSPSK